MSATIAPPEWLTVGAKVAVVTHGIRSDTVRMQTVERITATTAVVDGNRYRLDSLARGAGTSGPTVSLCDPKDPFVVAIVRRATAERASYRAEDALQKWRRAGFDAVSTADVRDALAALAPYMDPTEETQR